jgi:hypothetical protein
MEKLTGWYYGNKRMIISALLLIATVTSLFVKSDIVRSFSLGFAAGLLIVNLGADVAAKRAMRKGNKPAQG